MNEVARIAGAAERRRHERRARQRVVRLELVAERPRRDDVEPAVVEIVVGREELEHGRLVEAEHDRNPQRAEIALELEARRNLAAAAVAGKAVEGADAVVVDRVHAALDAAEQVAERRVAQRDPRRLPARIGLERGIHL